MRKVFIAICWIACLGNTAVAQTKQRPSRDELMNGSKNSKGIIDDPFIFKRAELQVSGDNVTNIKAFQEAIAKSDVVIKEYSDEVTKFLATNPSSAILKSHYNSTLSKAKGVDYEISKVADEYKKGNSLGSVYYLQNLYIFKGYLEGVTRIYSETQELKDKLESVKGAIAIYKSRDEFMNKMMSNQKEQVKNMKMIPAQQSNPKIEAMVKNEYEAAFKEFKVTKVNITYKTWIIDKNEFDIPICRKLSICVAVKNAKGECGIGSSNVKEDYIGGGKYGESYAYLPSDPIIVPCENIK